ncbi:MAG: nucleotidyltransferase domain-containing protein [Peptococcaceae bacterium]|jgi:predicted nucleotidyltransferase|nr:nucleotidyltransferase domain-containing protein [Peptococcaceae bacterium]
MKLSWSEQAALGETKSLLRAKFPVEEFIVFGSVARGEATDESDLDLLVLTSRQLSHKEEHAMCDVVFDINLSHGTNISILVADKTKWETGLLSLLPLHEEVEKDGVAL